MCFFVFERGITGTLLHSLSREERYSANNSIFDQLPPVFSLDDLASLKRGDMPRNSLVKILSRWRRDGWIEKVEQNRWQKQSGK